MKKFKEVTVPRKENHHQYTECDVCGKRCTYHSGKYDSTNWSDNPYDVQVTAIYKQIGYSYPEGGWYELTRYDICPDCFDKVVMEALCNAGAQPNLKDVDT